MRPITMFAAGCLALLPVCLDAQRGSDGSSRHAISFLLGAAVNTKTDEVGFASGPSYLYRVADRLSIGGGIEATYYDSESTFLFMSPLYLRPLHDLEFVVGPAVEFSHPNARDDGTLMGENSTRFGFRIGAAYEFLMPIGFSMGPKLTADFLSGGATFGFGVAFGFTL